MPETNTTFCINCKPNNSSKITSGWEGKRNGDLSLMVTEFLSEVMKKLSKQ